MLKAFLIGCIISLTISGAEIVIVSPIVPKPRRPWPEEAEFRAKAVKVRVNLLMSGVSTPEARSVCAPVLEHVLTPHPYPLPGEIQATEKKEMRCFEMLAIELADNSLALVNEETTLGLVTRPDGLSPLERESDRAAKIAMMRRNIVLKRGIMQRITLEGRIGYQETGAQLYRIGYPAAKITEILNDGMRRAIDEAEKRAKESPPQ